jgi:AcrR family transcriptional regulator
VVKLWGLALKMERKALKRVTARPRPKELIASVEHDRRRELLQATMEVIALKGIEGLRTREVAARAGVNISTLHYYFETKEALLLAVLHHIVEVLASSAQADSKARSAREELRALFIGAFGSFRENPQLATVLQELRLRSRRDASARKAFRDIHEDWNRAAKRILDRGIAEGEMRANLDAASGAMVITSFIMGVTLQLWVNPKACDFAAVSKELELWLTSD